MKNVGNKLHRRRFTSFRMRLAARLLILLREDSEMSCATMSDFISPEHFERVVNCAIKACDEDENENMKNPSEAIKFGYDLTRLASVKQGFGIKERNDQDRSEASDFIRLLQMEWSVKVSKLARVTLDERHFNKNNKLPDPADIQKLSSYLVKELTSIDLTTKDEVIYREAVILTEARLLLYNRRRPGELESLSLEAYKSRSRSVDHADLALRSTLTDFENMLLKTQDLVEIGGKTGRGVPVLLPTETQRVLDFLSNPDVRTACRIQQTNPYIFASTGDSVARAGDYLSQVKWRKEVGLQHPERIFANNLRKHTATIAQALSLTDTEMKWVCNHLGHTQKIHDQYYRQTSEMIERIDIAKLMLIQEHNVVGKFQNRKLSEIQFDELPIFESEDITKRPMACCDEERAHQGMPDDQVHDEFYLEDSGFTDRKKANKVTRIKWSKEEEEVRKYFEFTSVVKQKRDAHHRKTA